MKKKSFVCNAEYDFMCFHVLEVGAAVAADPQAQEGQQETEEKQTCLVQMRRLKQKRQLYLLRRMTLISKPTRR